MYFVYILESQKDHEWYIGYTEDINRRHAEHERGQTRLTANRGPFELMYYEAYLNKMDALGREKFLKSGAGHRFIRKQLKFYLSRDNN